MKKYTREASNLQPPVPKTGGANSELVSEPQVMVTAADGGPSVSPTALKVDIGSDLNPDASKGRKRQSGPAVETGNGSPDSSPWADFASALAMIATLPLNDAEKAEAVRRLLSGDGR